MRKFLEELGLKQDKYVVYIDCHSPLQEFDVPFKIEAYWKTLK